MSLSLVVLTKNGGERMERLLKWAAQKSYLDQIMVFLDETTTDGTEAICKASGAVLERVAVPTIDQALAYCHSPERIKTDWALYLGDDELMGQWLDDDIERLMRAPYDVYSFPRYNVVPNDEGSEGWAYVSSRPWYPDFCQRLFRPGYIVHSGELHAGVAPNGRLAMARPHVFHFDFIDQTRKEREEKWKRYLRQGVVDISRKRGLPDDYYKQFSLYEDYPHEIGFTEELL